MHITPTGFENSLTTTTTSDSTGWPYTYIYPQPFYNMTVSSQPQDCLGDVHVFHCPTCKTCRCGKAKLS